MKITKILAIFLLLLAVGLAILAWALGRQPARTVAPVVTSNTPTETSAEEQQSTHSAKKLYEVVAVNKSIAAGQRLTANDLKIIQIPMEIAETFSAVDEVQGRTAIVTLQPDTPVFDQQLLEGLALQLEHGQRAVSIAVKEPMAAGHHVRPGDFVDVFVTLDAADKSLGVDTQTRLLLARARVLAYGASTVEAPPPTAAQKRTQEQGGSNVQRAGEEQRQRPQAINTAVLAVQLDEVQRLALAEKYGFLNLALRHPDDLSVPDASLFAALPTALRPLRANSVTTVLDSADRAYAGLKMKDLADGGAKAQPPLSKTAVHRSRAQKTVTTSPARTVEVLSGTEVKTVRY